MFDPRFLKNSSTCGTSSMLGRLTVNVTKVLPKSSFNFFKTKITLLKSAPGRHFEKVPSLIPSIERLN